MRGLPRRPLQGQQPAHHGSGVWREEARGVGEGRHAEHEGRRRGVQTLGEAGGAAERGRRDTGREGRRRGRRGGVVVVGGRRRGRVGRSGGGGGVGRGAAAAGVGSRGGGQGQGHPVSALGPGSSSSSYTAAAPLLLPVPVAVGGRCSVQVAPPVPRHGAEEGGAQQRVEHAQPGQPRAQAVEVRQEQGRDHGGRAPVPGVRPGGRGELGRGGGAVRRVRRKAGVPVPAGVPEKAAGPLPVPGAALRAPVGPGGRPGTAARLGRLQAVGVGSRGGGGGGGGGGTGRRGGQRHALPVQQQLPAATPLGGRGLAPAPLFPFRLLLGLSLPLLPPPPSLLLLLLLFFRLHFSHFLLHLHHLRLGHLGLALVRQPQVGSDEDVVVRLLGG